MRSISSKHVGSVAMFIATLGATVGVSACDSCDGPPPTPSNAGADASILDLAPKPTVAELDEMWAKATAGLDVKKAEPFPIVYRIPSCSIRYEMRYVVLAEVAEGREPAGVEVVAPFMGNPDTDRLTWQLGALRTFLMRDGERTERKSTSKRMKWTPVLARTDGRRWFEDDGPSTLWTAHSVVPPLVSQFPTVTSDGGAHTWAVDTYSKRTTDKIEKRREQRPDAGVPNLPSEGYEVALSLRGFVSLTQDVNGAPRTTRVALIDGKWHTERTLIDPQESRRAEHWVARWAISDTGRVVHGISMAGRYQWWQVSERERNSKIGSAEIEMRLVEDCDTVTLPRFRVAD